MKKVYLFIFIAVSIILINCKGGDEFVPSKANGTVYYQDNIIEGLKNLATEADVFISSNTEADPFITKFKADKEAKFTIDFEPKRQDLYLVGEWKDSRGILFKGNVKLLSSGTELMLSPRYPRGKIKVTVKDAGMQPVNGVEVYLFVNESLAGSVAAGAPKGFFKKETTDENGIAFFYDLAPNTY